MISVTPISAHYSFANASHLKIIGMMLWSSVGQWAMGIRGIGADPYLWLMDPDPTPDPTPFFNDFKGVLFFYNLSTGTVHHLQS